MSGQIERLVEKAREGDRDALEDLVRHIQDGIYGLAMRMLYLPADAEDAAQEILIKVITHLGDFAGRSAFTTWVYRIAANHLLSTRKRRAERAYHQNFEDCEAEIDRILAEGYAHAIPRPEMNLLVEEMRISCTQAMLLCLDRKLRLAYVLGEVFEVSGKEGAFILGVTPEAFRKRVSRARGRLQEFMLKNCGLVNENNRCACEKMIPHDIGAGRIDARNLVFTRHPCRGRREPLVRERLHELGELERVAAIFKSHPEYAAPDAFVLGLKELVDSGRYELL